MLASSCTALSQLQRGRVLAARAFASLSKDTATGLNLLKKGSDPPLKPDEELPNWLWGLGETEKTLNELKRADESSLTLREMKRFIKLENRDDIRRRNHSKAK